MKKGFLAFILGTILCLPCYGLAHEPVTVEGTIQGLLSTCAGETCTPREEVIIAAMEDTFVLVSDEGKYYLLPNIKNSVLSRHLGDPVKVSGFVTLEETAIQVETAEVFEKGEWEGAIQIYDKVLWLDPEHTTARLNRGMALSQLGRFHEARQSLSRP